MIASPRILANQQRQGIDPQEPLLLSRYDNNRYQNPLGNAFIGPYYLPSYPNSVPVFSPYDGAKMISHDEKP